MAGIPRKTDVLVIGAGISGLSAAKLLKEQGVDVVVLEARDRVGGRTYTLRDPAYQYTDVGGAYVGPTQRRILRLAKELGLELYKVDDRGKSVMNVKGSVYHYLGTIPNIHNPMVAMDLNHIMRRMDNMAKQVPVDAPWRAKKAKEWDAMTCKEFFDKQCWTHLCRVIADSMVQNVLCTEPHEVSLLFLLWYIASGQGLQRLANITNGAQERKFKGGSQQVSERIADTLGDVVKLSSPVMAVEQGDTHLVVTTVDGTRYQAQYVISAVPPVLLSSIRFEPPLPPAKVQMIQRMPLGSIFKTMMFYERAFWKEKGFCGQLFSGHGPILYCMDDTKPDGSVPCIMGFLLANNARELLSLTTDERKRRIARHYADQFGCEDFLHPVNYVEHNWNAETYSGGCYTCYMGPGVLTQYGQTLREPDGRIFWAGTETATCWSGYMDGAVQAGERAARQVLHAQGEIGIGLDDVWVEEPLDPEFPECPFPEELIEKVLPSVPQFLFITMTILVVLLAVMIKFLT